LRNTGAQATLRPMTSLQDQLHALLGHQVGKVHLRLSQTVARTALGSWLLEDLRFDTGAEVIAAQLLRPAGGAATRPCPVVLYCHAHGNRYDTGCVELSQGRPALQGPYLPDLMQLGVGALCLEMPCFGARQQPPEGPRAKAGLWAGKPLFGQMLAELSAGLNWLETQDWVNAGRIGAMGISMGGTHAWWLGALDPRLHAVASLCCFADLETLAQTGAHDGHGIYMTVPGLFPVARSGQIAGLTAPRAHLVCAGLDDWSTPDPALRKGLEDLRTAYTRAPDMLETHIVPGLGHAESVGMRAAVHDFLRRRLCD